MKASTSFRIWHQLRRANKQADEFGYDLLLDPRVLADLSGTEREEYLMSIVRARSRAHERSMETYQ